MVMIIPSPRRLQGDGYRCGDTAYPHALSKEARDRSLLGV
jgi:hypothetical protein